MTTTATNTETVHRCLRPGCGRKLSSPESIARGMGRTCARKVREAEAEADLSAWTDRQVEEARQALEDGAVVTSTRQGVYHVVAVDGSEVHLTHRDGCNCAGGLQSRPPRPCWHRCAVAMLEAASAPAPALVPAPAALVALPPAPVPAPAYDVWAALEAAGATGADLIPAF